ncbi:CHAD domain-containing protein [Streptomyces buecherae]|uniref:CHAD domain-containing protein n=1 Tax=Streptomyces buecherae TaxID=2763006 RepID=UPI0033CFF1EC
MTDYAMGSAVTSGDQGQATTAGDVLSRYLHAQAGDFLRSLRLHRESGSDAEEAVEAARLLRQSARRISGVLHTYRPLTDPVWADQLRAELAWLSGMLAREHAYAARLARLRGALHRLSGAPLPEQGADRPAGPPPGPGAGRARVTGTDNGDAPGAAGRTARGARSHGATAAGAPAVSAKLPADGAGGRAVRAGRLGEQRSRDAQAGRGGRDGREALPGERAGAARSTGRAASAGNANPGPAGAAGGPAGTRGEADEARPGALTVGAARAGALLERQLTLARTRAHTAALQALGSSRFHAVADAVALLASDVPLIASAADEPADTALPPLAELAHRRLLEAIDALPLGRAGHPYNAEALTHGLAATPSADAPPASEAQDAPWHQVRRLVRIGRYALEVLDEHQPLGTGPTEAEPTLAVRLLAASQALERHRDAAEAAAAAAAAARTPRIAPATAYALGILHADQRHEVEAARFAFGRIWQRAATTP